MKLIDILVQELPKHGGWPDDVQEICQSDVDTQIYMCSKLLPDFYADVAAEDREGGVVTREQYEAAISGSDVGRAGSSVDLTTKWNGEGLPPVGCECEVSWAGTKWSKCRTLFIGDEIIVVRRNNRDVVYCKVDVEFRPLRSEADRKRLEVAEALIRFLDSETDIDNVFRVGDVTGFLDYIAAGKIPGVKPDDSNDAPQAR